MELQLNRFKQPAILFLILFSKNNLTMCLITFQRTI